MASRALKMSDVITVSIALSAAKHLEVM